MMISRSVRDTGSAFDFIQVRIARRGIAVQSQERERLEMAGVRSWWSWGEVTSRNINYRCSSGKGGSLRAHLRS